MEQIVKVLGGVLSLKREREQANGFEEARVAEAVTLEVLAAQVILAEDQRRVSEVVVSRLDRAQMWSVLQEAQDSGTPLSQAALQVCLQCWSRLLEERLDDWGFVVKVAEWIDSTESIDISVALTMANRLAWISSGDPTLPRLDAWPSLRREAPNYFLVALYCNRPRFLFQYKRLDRVLDILQNSGERSFVEWPLVKAYRSFEILGQRHHRLAEGRRLALEAWDAADVDPSYPSRREVLDVILHALDSAAQADALADDVLSIAVRLSDEDLEPVVLYRLCRARNRLANAYRRTRPTEVRAVRDRAFEDVQQALHRLRGDNDFTRFFGEQLRAQRDQVLASRELDDSFVRIAAAEEVMRSAEDFVRQESRTNTIRSTEILALFSSAVAFAVGAAAIGANATSPWASAAIGVALGVGLLGFSALLLAVGRIAAPRTSGGPVDRAGTSRWLVLGVILSSVVSVAALLVAILVAPHLATGS